MEITAKQARRELAADGNRALLTEGDVAGHLARLALPTIWGLAAIISQPLVDSYFVGQLGTFPLAAMSFLFPVVLIFSSVAVGLGVGISAMLAQFIGAGEGAKVCRTTTDGILLTLVVTGLLTLAGLLSIGPLFQFLGATPEITIFVRDYMIIWYAAAIMLTFPIVGTACLRAKGLSGASSAVMILMAGVNVVLDPILIFGLLGAPELGFVGAAWATVAANIAGTLLTLYFLVVREKMIDFRLPPVKVILAEWRVILHVGLPTALTNLANPVAIAIIVKIVAGLDAAAVAAFGVAFRIEALAFIVPHALSMIIGPFVGQNFGAGQGQRIHEALKTSLSFSLLYGLIVALALGLGGRWIGAQFSDDPAVIEYTAIYLMIVPMTFFFFAITRIVAGAFNALSRPRPNVVFFVVKLALVYIPLSYLGVRWWGFWGVAIASAASNVISGGLAYWWYRTRLAGAAEQSGG